MITFLTAQKALSAAWSKTPILLPDMQNFAKQFDNYLKGAKDGESEEYHKNLIAKLLENKMRSSGLKVNLELYDERFSTKIAEQVLFDAGYKRKERKQYVDKQAAVVILSSYMDSLRLQGRYKEET